MTNPWLDAQKKMMEYWANAMQSPFAANPVMETAANGAAQSWPQPWAIWQNMFWQSMEPMRAAWTLHGDMAQTAQDTAEKMLASQMHLMQLMQNVAQAWQVLAQSAATGEDWRAALTRYVEQLRTQWTAAAEQWYALGGSSADLWGTYLEQMQQSGQPWLQAWVQSVVESQSQMGRAMTQAMTDVMTKGATNGFSGNAAFPAGMFTPSAVFGPYWDAFDQTVGALINSPTLGLTREYVAELTEAFDAWVENRRAEFDYYAILHEGWLRTFETLMRRLVQQVQAGQPVQTPRQLLDLWVEIGDRELTELFATERYANAQANLVNTSMTLRLKQRNLLEDWLHSNDMPTRSDVDEAHKVIHDLRKEVRALKKTLGTVQNDVSAVAESQSQLEQAQAAAAKQAKASKAASKKTTRRKSSQAKSTTKSTTKSAGAKRSTGQSTTAASPSETSDSAADAGASDAADTTESSETT